MLQYEKGLQCATPRKEAKLCARNFVIFFTPILDQGAQQVGIESVEKKVKINGFKIQHILFENGGVYQFDTVKPSMADKRWEDQRSLDLMLSCMSAFKTFFILVLSQQGIAAQNQPE